MFSEVLSFIRNMDATFLFFKITSKAVVMAIDGKSVVRGWHKSERRQMKSVEGQIGISYLFNKCFSHAYHLSQY